MDTVLPTKFVNQPSMSLFCPLCQKLFQDPVISIGCGHTFCRNCIDNRLLAMTHLTCPVDNVKIDLNNIVPNRAVQGQLEDLLIYCRHGLKLNGSESGFEQEEDGCKEQISLGRRHEHEEHCLMAWVPCTNCSNQCGKFRKKDLTAHLTTCAHHMCLNEKKGCTFRGTREELKQHMCKCEFSANGVEWDVLSSLDGENAMDGLQAKYLVKAVKNLNERVSSLEQGNKDVVYMVEKCNSNIMNLSIQVEKLTRTVEHMRVTQNAMLRDRLGSHSASDLATHPAYRRTFSTMGLHTYNNARTRSSSSSGPTHLFSFSEPRHEKWKMPLSFKCVGTFRGHSGIIRAMASRGPYVFSGAADHSIKVWDIKDRDMKNSRGCIATFTGHVGDIHALCFSSGFVYSAGTDKSLKAWDVEKLQLHLSIEDAHSDLIGALASTGKYIFSGSYSSIKIWRAMSLELMHTISDTHHWIRAFAVDPKKKKVYSGSHNVVHIWETEEPFRSIGKLTHSHGSVYSLAVTKEFLILGTYNQNTHLYNANTHQYVKVLTGHIGVITGLLPSPSGNFLFTASYDHTIQLWDLVKLLPVQVLSRHEGSVNCMALSGDMLFTGSEDKEIKVYMYIQGLASKNLMVG